MLAEIVVMLLYNAYRVAHKTFAKQKQFREYGDCGFYIRIDVPNLYCYDVRNLGMRE